MLEGNVDPYQQCPFLSRVTSYQSLVVKPGTYLIWKQSPRGLSKQRTDQMYPHRTDMTRVVTDSLTCYLYGEHLSST